MAGHESKSKQKTMKKRKLRRVEEEEEQGPPKASRTDHSERENDPPREEAGQRESMERLEDGPPWRNLQLILSLQKKDIVLEKKVVIALDYIKSRVREDVDDDSRALETISISRVIAFLNDWVQSLLISSEKKNRVDGDKSHVGSCFDYRCWEIFKFCAEESLKQHILLSYSRDFLRVVHCIARDALSHLNAASLHSLESVFSGEKLELYSMVLDCISLVFSSHGGVSNENLDLWILIIDTVLKLVQKVICDMLDGGKVVIFVLQFSCFVLEPFTKFLRVHPTRKNGFHDFIDKLLEPLLHLLDVLHLHICGRNPGWTRNLLKLVEEVLSQGLFHPSHIDGFMSLQGTGKYKTFDDGKSKDLKTVIKSYHRHLFDKLEKIIAGKNALALGGVGELFRLFVNCVKNQKNVPARGGGSRILEDDSTFNVFKSSSGSSSVVAEMQKSVFDFFVQIMEPLLLEINNLLAELEVGPVLLDAHCALKSTNKILVIFIHENIYRQAEDISEGACFNFLKVIYDMIILFSAKINLLQLSNFGLDKEKHKEVLIPIVKELIVAVRYLLEIEYEVIGVDLESLWVFMFSFGHSLMDVPDASLLTSEIIHLGCQLVNLYSELRQVNKAIFVLCKSVRHLVLPVRDGETSTTSSHYELYAKSLRMLLCSTEFRLSIYNAIKSIPEGQASGCIRQLTTDISESLDWIKVKCSLAAGNELGKLDLSTCTSSCYNVQAELLGKGLSEVYTLILDSMTVTAGNSNLIGVSVKGLMAVIRPSMRCLVALQPDSLNEFISIVMGRTFSDGAGFASDVLSTHWVLVFFFRLYMSCRSLYRQGISFVPPDTSIKMSELMGDPFTAYSGMDWLERTGWMDEGYFSWIVQPSASLLTIIQAVSDIYLQDTVADCSPLIYVLTAMALQRIVDLNRLIKYFEYLLRRNDLLTQTKLKDDAGLSLYRKKGRKWEKSVSGLRQEAAGLTDFMMGYLPLVAKDQLAISSSDDATHKNMSAYENYEWDFSVGAVNKKSFSTAIWWIFCQNVDIWCAHVSKKKLKMFLSLLIQNSTCSLDDLGKHITNKSSNLKKVTTHQISLELLNDTVMYEQKFVRRHMASRFCRILEKSVLPIFSKYGEVDLNLPLNWPEVLSALEISRGKSVSHSFCNLPVDYCKEQELRPSINTVFTTCQSLLNFLCWMPKGYLTSRSFSLYATYILNLERLVVASLLDWRGALHSHSHYEHLRLFVSCRRALKNLIMASCEEKMGVCQYSLTSVLSECSFPILWLLKSLSAVIGLQHAFSEDRATLVKHMTFSLMDHTSYLFLTLSKNQFLRSIHSAISVGKPREEKPSSAVAREQSDLIEFDPCLDSCKIIDAWKNVVLVAETLKEQTTNLLTSLKEASHNEEVGVFAGLQDLKKLSSMVSSFEGFLWGLGSALDSIDVKSCDFKTKLSRWKFEPIYKLNLCIDIFTDFINHFLHKLLLEDDETTQNLSDAQILPVSVSGDDRVGVGKSLCAEFGDIPNALHEEEEQQNSGTARNCSALSDIKDDSRKRVSRKRTILTNVEHQSLKNSLLRGFLKGENLEAAFFLRQLFIAAAAILRLNLQMNCTSLSSSLVSILISISQVLLLEFTSKVVVPQPFSFVWLDGVVKFLEELGSHFPLSDPTLSRNMYVKLIELQLRALGKCISLQGKEATLASHDTESSSKMLNGQIGSSESTLSHGPYCLDEFKARLRISFKVFVNKSSELHLLSALQAIERALVGVQEGCMINYEICTGSADGGKVSSIVAGAIDCLDLVLDFISGRKRLNVVKRHIQSLVACLFNIILHLQGPKIFYGNVNPDRGAADPDPGSVILMCVEVLMRVSGKHALFRMDACHVSQSLRLPSALFQNFLQLRISKAHSRGQSTSLKFLDIEDTKSVISMKTCVVDRHFTIALYAACCRLLCTILKHHKSDGQRCTVLLEDSVSILLHCLETVDTVPVVRKNDLSWEVQEGVKCACFLRRVYEEIRQQKDVFGRDCFHLLSNYIWVYCGYGPLKTGIRREIDEALRPGVYALVDACSPDDLQYLHTVFGEGSCRSTLATLQHDYKQNFQYGGKV